MKAEAWAEAEREAVRRGLLPKGGYMTIREEIEERGIQKGIRRGRQNKEKEVILNMLQEKLDAALIAKVTGLPEAEIIKFKNGEIKNSQPKAGIQNGKAE